MRTSPVKTSARLWPSLLIFAVLAAIGLIGLTQAERIHDWFRLRNYQPSADIAQIVQDTAMNDRGKHLFYINHPQLEDKTTFRNNCPEYEATIVLGCYRHNQGGIHVLRVDDDRLEGIEQVTAAHEMLHAAYDRLSASEKSQLHGWLEAYSNRLTDQRIKDTIKDYERTEPGEHYNEMHSVFGTEVTDLTPELEQYYRRYFNDRQVVARLANQYQAAFSSRQDQVKQYDQQLAAINRRVKLDTETLGKRRADLERLENQLETYRRNQDIEQYNSGVNEYNQAVQSYNELLEQTKASIEDYNQIVEARNEIAVQTVELQQAIDSAALPISQ